MGKKTIVVAYSLNRTIGNDNKLLWKQSADLKRFKEITSGGIVIMGRKTYESIGRQLPNRRNIVISRSKIDGVETMTLDQVRGINDDVFIIGGGEIYKQLISESDEILATLIHKNLDGDTSFPEIDDTWILKSAEYHNSDDSNEFGYSFLRYTRFK